MIPPLRLPELDPMDFSLFHESVHGRRAYGWQVRAAAELAAGREWQTLSAPTAAGKTTLIDCFLFALAFQASSPHRALGRRLFWVVDRRSVVDQVFAHARTVARALEEGSSGPVRAVAERLSSLSGGLPIEVRLWRGGIADDELAAGPRVPLSPASCAVVCSTVDQVGSRLLFRGYGTSRRSRPIDAALVGTDSLVILDEAHIAGPFLDTARTVAEMQSLAGVAVPRMRVVAVSATPTAHAERQQAFKLTDTELSEEPLARRLRARKLVDLVHGTTPDRLLASTARKLSDGGSGVIGVIANTVSSARDAFEQLRSRGDALLVIGPSRPIDRQGVLTRVPDRSDRHPMPRPLFVVATQTIEVGLDIDFDALVTACAPWPALIQRLGRLDRAGELGESHAAVVAPPRRCPVYGDATQETWDWLTNHATENRLELGAQAISSYRHSDLPPHPAEPLAPILGSWHVDALMQTSHDDVPDPDISLFLHGERVLEAADVQIAWRADLETSGLGDWARRVRLRPPHRDELLSVSVAAVRRWLAVAPDAIVADVESAAQIGNDDIAPGRPAVRVPPPGPDGTVTPEVIGSKDARAGDVLVVPASFGGCDEFGWAPGSSVRVTDLGNLARRSPRILIDHRLGAPHELVAAADEILAAMARDDVDAREAYEELVHRARAWMAGGGGFPLGSSARDISTRVAELLGSRGRVTPDDSDSDRRGAVVLAPAPPHRREQRSQISYHDHVKGVERAATELAVSLGLSEELISTITHAARWHDAGKLDPRFQAWLNDGAPADPGKPLAKSGRFGSDPRIRSAREAAGWPAGMRHEQISARLAASIPTWPADVQRDLLLHLVATHHGDGRPFRSFVADPAPAAVSVTIDGMAAHARSDDPEPWVVHASRFLDLAARFGPWGLALLESVLVIADRSVSAAESS